MRSRKPKRQQRQLKLERSRRKSDALRLASRLTAEAGDILPIDLKPLRERRAVRAIRFQPLLTDGTLVVLQNGFQILIRCREQTQDSLTALFQRDETGSELPAELVRQSRFTIAHEIAHTLLYDIRTTPPRPKHFVARLYDAADVEAICNKLAAKLLLPETAIERDFPNADLLDPKVLKRISDAALISRPVLVLRLRELRRVSHPFGIVTVVKKKAASWYFSALSAHYSIPRQLVSQMSGQSVSSILGPSSSFLFKGGADDLTFRWANPIDGITAVFIYNVEGLRPEQSSAFLTLRRMQ